MWVLLHVVERDRNASASDGASEGDQDVVAELEPAGSPMTALPVARGPETTVADADAAVPVCA